MNCTRPGAILIALLTIGGCVAPHRSQTSWTAGYHRQIADAHASSTGLPGFYRVQIVPAKCRGDHREDKRRLPPGCANDLNLERMAARPSDLLRGREMGPPRAGPIARAAREQLENSQKLANERRIRLQRESREQIQLFEPPASQR